ncbi:hypothetical protein HJC23_005808 [Cyclotella cryptica]|uniref:Uncharacterized protein n=1 Tax=Cyclotella cryptica TaxID=29204 RepID=A0ABD3QZ61_9STRA
MKGVTDATKNKSSDFLDKLESSHDLNSVGTDQLLDMLEHEVYHAESPSRGSQPTTTTEKRRTGAERRRRISCEGYSSGEASFTSSFLGGLEEDKALAIESEVSKSRQGDATASKDRKLLSKSFTKIEGASKNIELVGSPVKTGNYSDSNMSKTSLRRQPFDNPFRSQQHDIFHKRDDKDGSGSVSVASASSKSRNGILTALGGRNVEKHSVSFSSKEKSQSYASKPHEPTSPQKYDFGDSQFETFSLGSLGSLAVSASTRTSHPSYITKSTRSSRSSRSSRSTHSGSTHSSHSAQERRQRRELHPDGSIGSGRRRRRRSGSSSRDLEMGAKTSRRKMHPDLHSHHPTRYPKRSGMYGQIEEGDEDNHHERFDELYDGIAMGGSDDEGLFRRVDKVKKTIKSDNNDDFLDALLAKKPVAKEARGDDSKSIGDASFLSDFLNKRATQNGTKQRKGTTTTSRVSSVSSLNHLDNTFKDKENCGTSKYAMSVFKQTVYAALRKVQQWYKDGYLFPRTRVEFVKYGLMAMIIAPLFHVALTILIDGRNHMHRGISPHAIYHGNELKGLGSTGDILHSRTKPDNWEGSSQVMLSASSSLKENFILIPDADWIDWKPSPPERLALPLRLDHRDKPDAAMVLFSISASNSKDDLLTNTDANIKLWEEIQDHLNPKPIDVWPSWYHDSSSHFREDGFTLMYSIRKRDDAKRALIIMAEKFGQSSLYEFVAWNDFGYDAQRSAAKPRKFAERLRGGKTDVMIRTTISTEPEITSGRNDRRGKAQKPVIKEEPALVMRRVKELPVEDELTLREYEGPPLEDILWSK